MIETTYIGDLEFKRSIMQSDYGALSVIVPSTYGNDVIVSASEHKQRAKQVARYLVNAFNALGATIEHTTSSLSLGYWAPTDQWEDNYVVTLWLDVAPTPEQIQSVADYAGQLCQQWNQEAVAVLWLDNFASMQLVSLLPANSNGYAS